MQNNRQSAIHSVGLAAATCVAEMLGGGIVGLPYVVVQTYVIFGGLMIVFGAILTYYTGYLLAELYLDMFNNKEPKLLEEISSEHSALDAFDAGVDDSINNPKNEQLQEQTPYLAIARKAWPSFGEYICGFAVSVTLLFVDIVFLVLCGMNLLSMVGDDTIISSQTICIIIFAIATLILSYAWRKVQHYKYFICPAVLSTFIAVILAFPVVIHNAPKPTPPIPPLSHDTLHGYLQAYGTIMFAFGGHAGFPTYQRNMGLQYQHLFSYAIGIAYAYIFIMVFPFSIMIAKLYGENVEDNILNNLPTDNVTSLIITALITFHMISSIATLVPPVAGITSKIFRVIFTRSFGARNDTRVYWWSPIVVQLLAAIIAISLQDNFMIVMGTLGNTTVTLSTFVMPCLLYVMHFRHRISMWSRICCCVCVTVGILTGIVAVGTTIYDLIHGH